MKTLLEEADEMQKYLELEYPYTVTEIIERIKILSGYMARSGAMLADARKLYRRKVSSEIANTIIKIAKENYLSAKAQNALVSAIAEDEAFLVDKLERINRTCVHQIEALRTILSFEKESLRLGGYD
ncbi:MAG TPA: hypothetical protein PLM44_02340 [bacterium]|nr:hypothetical protein [bacterium]